MRRFLKGDEGMIQDVICQLKNQDTQLYNYIASHNGFTLCDVVSYDGKHNEANGENNLDGPDYNYSWNCGAEGNSRKKAVNELRKNQIFNAFFLLLFAQGMPCILSGDEFMNTQKGNNNAYCQDNLISWLDWNQLSRQEELYTFVCRLIALRKACMKQIAKKSEDTMGRSGIPQISYHGEDAWQMPAGRASRQLGVFYHEESTEKDFYIAYNMHWLSHSFALPSLPKGMEWVCMAGTKEGVLDEKEAVPVKDKKVQLEERTIKVLLEGRLKNENLETFCTITHHKYLVMKNCFKVGLYRQGLLHDMSKYSPAEFWVGCRYFQGNRSPNNAEREEKGYSSAWLHHKGRNKHHYEYWIDYGLEGEPMLTGMKMPKKYVVEMLMDRIAASKIYMKDKYTDTSPLEYYLHGIAGDWMHKDTRALLEELLYMLAADGEEKTFDYIRNTVLKTRDY